jgi:hypothetical protein
VGFSNSEEELLDVDELSVVHVVIPIGDKDAVFRLPVVTLIKIVYDHCLTEVSP